MRDLGERRPVCSLGWPWRLMLLTILAGCQPSNAANAPLAYGAVFQARFVPGENLAQAQIAIVQNMGEVRLLDFAAPDDRYSGFAGDGEITRNQGRVQWRVPRGGGTLHYRVTIDHRRNGAYDARMTDQWAIMRLDDMFPAARVRSRVGATSRSTVQLHGPQGWAFETRYGSASHARSVEDPDRQFDRPTGWAVAGKLGIRRDRIAGRRIAIAAPVGEQFRRMDTMVFLGWTLPALVEVFPEFPDHLLIVGASDGMWHGGLSGPGALYLHAERPLVSENGTSSVLHELVHIATGEPAPGNNDWLVEGLAEFYSLEILRRTGGISEHRYAKAMQSLAAWVRRDKGRRAEPSTGANTAWAVLKLRAVSDELAGSGTTLDEIVADLIRHRTLSGRGLQEQVARALGHPSPALADIAP